jgi:hypothetical protein
LGRQLKLLVANPQPEASAPGEFSDYEDGKRRRYELFFAVNGGAFAVASWLLQDGHAVGGLRLTPIGYGLASFTWLMSLDLFAFGLAFRRFFGRPGRLVIIGLSTIIASGWLLAGSVPAWAAVPVSFAMALVAAVVACLCVDPDEERGESQKQDQKPGKSP